MRCFLLCLCVRWRSSWVDPCVSSATTRLFSIRACLRWLLWVMMSSCKLLCRQGLCASGSKRLDRGLLQRDGLCGCMAGGGFPVRQTRRQYDTVWA